MAIEMEYYEAYEGFSEAENRVYLNSCVIKQLWVDSDDSEGLPLLARDNADEAFDCETYTRISVKRKNILGVKCKTCQSILKHGWDNGHNDSYCDDHVKIMN
jgi:hypothetical protein